MDKLLTTKEVAEILGISETTAKIWASRRVFPVVKVGRLIRISPTALQRWIEINTEKNIEDRNDFSCDRRRRQNKPGSFDDFR